MKISLFKKQSITALSFSIFASLSASAVQTNELRVEANKNNTIPFFVSAKDTKSVSSLNASNSSKITKSYSGSHEVWPVQKKNSRERCVRWEDFRAPNMNSTAKSLSVNSTAKTNALNDLARAPQGECVEWETYYYYTNYGTADVFKSSDGILDKPVVVVQPYQFSVDDSPVEYSAYQFYSQINTSGLADDMIRDGYDVILFRYANVENGIVANANGLQVLLEKLNTISSISSTSVVGLSMGGVVARYALTKMEYTGTPNNVSTYISFDAPHLGANFPKSIMDNLKRLESKIDVFGCGLTNTCQNPRNDLRAILKRFDTQTFKDLIIDAPSGSSDRLAWQSSLANMGNFPSVPSLALTNGSHNHTTQGYPTTKMTTDFKLHRPWYLGGSKTFKIYTTPYKDNVAGGYLNSYQLASDKLVEEANGTPLTVFVASGQNHSFVSTNSALAGSPNNTPFTLVAEYPATNEMHMTLTSSKADAIKDWLKQHQY
ncbi:esterase/lipase family protein [Aliikangiella coralliicola]|uniref:DUF676 domain-containing protein n=1 Tax=Aliikangiella coralliicola TaxID=2592383 RepID=A0A545UIZ8_9GAMM|nr:hypothetical protein [Aliikangiella coralliicola]TQV89442.1 hypothetical protein FLL46_00745 [Aliikangiella coralliicola]